jgi:RNA recognition motif-containing protein
MSKRLFVGGLPYSVTSSQLQEMFSKFGEVVSCDVITDRATNQSKGFGFVEMKNDTEADEAINKLNDTKLDGRKIAVNIAKPREDRPRSDNQRGGYSKRNGRRSRGNRRY